MRKGWLVAAGLFTLLCVSFTQLVLGCSVMVLILCLSTLAVSLMPLWIYRGDLYSMLSVILGVRYVGVAMLLKTLLGQALDDNLHYPVSAFAITLVINVIYQAVLFIARLTDNRRALANKEERSTSRLDTTKIISLIIGSLFLIALLGTRSLSSADAQTGFIVVLIIGARIFTLYLVSESVSAVIKSKYTTFLNARLFVALFGQLLFALASNVRELLVSSMVGIAMVSICYRTLNVRHVLIGAVFAIFFSVYLSPVTLYLRFQREGNTGMTFVNIAISTLGRAIVDPEFLHDISDMQTTTVDRSLDDMAAGYDYYGDESNVKNRLSFVALVDWAYTGMYGRSALGWQILGDSLERVIPRFLYPSKQEKIYGIGDRIAWETGQYPYGQSSYLNYSLPMEGYATFGWIGLVSYPFIFLLPLLYVITRMASFRIPTAESIFLFAVYQHIFVEATTEVLLSELTRSIPIYLSVLVLIKGVRGRPLAVPASRL